MACLRFSFWALNGGLMAMCVLSLLPVGLMQTWASVEHGYWYARAEIFAYAPDAESALDACAWGYAVCSGSRGAGDFCCRAENGIHFGDPIDGRNR